MRHRARPPPDEESLQAGNPGRRVRASAGLRYTPPKALLFVFGSVLAVGIVAAVGLIWSWTVLDADIIVVGAGASGIAAASALTQAGFGRVIVVEAQGRAGGRLHSVEFSPREHANGSEPVAGIAANIGASWIHHAGGNPLTHLAKFYGCRLAPVSNGLAHFFDKMGNRLPDTLAKETYQQVQTAMTAFLVARERSSRGSGRNFKRGEDMDLASALSRFVDAQYAAGLRVRNATTEDVADPQRSLKELHYFRNVVQDLTADLEQISALQYNEEVWGGMGQDVILLDGFDRCVFQKMLEEVVRSGMVKALFSSPVVGVAHATTPWGSPRVSVKVLHSRALRARYAVITVPLGVLKTSVQLQEAAAESRLEQVQKSATTALHFAPPLPKRFRAAVQRLGLGSALRVALEFPHAFWTSAARQPGSSESDLPESIVIEGEAEGSFGHGAHLEFTVLNTYWDAVADGGRGSNARRPAVLVAEADGNASRRLSEMSDESLSDFLWSRLAAAYGKHIVPKPLQVVSERFVASPFTGYGSFAFTRKGSLLQQDMSALAGPTHWPLVFAGEHTSPLQPGTVDGAFLSGIAAAYALLCTNGHDPGQAVPAALFVDVWKEHCLESFGITQTLAREIRQSLLAEQAAQGETPSRGTYMQLSAIAFRSSWYRDALSCETSFWEVLEQCRRPETLEQDWEPVP